MSDNNFHSRDLVQEFHESFGHPVRITPTVGTAEERILRTKLILEELLELAHACGLEIVQCDEDNGDTQFKVIKKDHVTPDLIKIADALGDLDYVVQGANLVFGLPSKDIFKEIHNSNMSKLGEDGKPIYREDGKILKGPNYFEPNITKIIESKVIDSKVGQ